MAQISMNKELLELSGYLKSMTTRLDKLNKVSQENAEHIDELSRRTSQKREVMSEKVNQIKQEAAELKQEVRDMQRAMIQIINHLKSSVKNEELERFKKRIDVWGPENMVNRSEANKLIK